MTERIHTIDASTAPIRDVVKAGFNSIVLRKAAPEVIGQKTTPRVKHPLAEMRLADVLATRQTK